MTPVKKARRRTPAPTQSAPTKPQRSTTTPASAGHDYAALRRAAPGGSYEANRWWAAEEAEEQERFAASATHPDLDKLVRMTFGAWSSAVALAKLTRIESIELHTFVAAEVRLHEYQNRLRSLDIATLMRRWPWNPGTTFHRLAGDSSLEVAMNFAKNVYAGVAWGLGETRVYDVHSLDAEKVHPDPSQKLLDWYARAMTELRTMTLAELPAWPLWELQRDSAALDSKLRYEWNEATKPDRVVVEKPVIDPTLSLPPKSLHPTAFKALELIKNRQVGQAMTGEYIASRIGVDTQHFHRKIVPKLKDFGVRSGGRGPGGGGGYFYDPSQAKFRPVIGQ
jgi:hypothetical protein